MTFEDVLALAYGKVAKSNPASLTASEGIDLVHRTLSALMSFAGRVNPTYFAVLAEVPYAAGWPRPAAAENVFRVETLDAVEVAIVPYDDRTAEEGMPSIYSLGRHYYQAGVAAGPGNVTLVFFYSKRPTKPAALTESLDALWDEHFNDLLVCEVALALAMKDGRAEDVQTLTVERDKWVELYTAFLQHETSALRRRFGHVATHASHMRAPTGSVK